MPIVYDLTINSCGEFGFTVKTMNALFALSNVLDHQVAVDVKGDFLSNFLYILIIFKWQIHKDDFSNLNCCG